MSLFITFEGIEGSGKTTQIKLLKNALQKKGYKVRVTREPGGTPISDQIRQVLLNRKNKSMVPLTELFLYEASRAQHVEEVIRPALQKKMIVISDRYSDATTVYQGEARKLSPVLVKYLNQVATRHLKPNLTLGLDCAVHHGLSRARKRSEKSKFNRFEQEKDHFHDKIRKGYLALAKKEPRRVKVVHGERPPLMIHNQ